MEPISFTQALHLPAVPGVTTLVGGGGKSSLAYTLAGEYAAQGLAPIVTTTTHIGYPRQGSTLLRLAHLVQPHQPLAQPGRLVCVAAAESDRKLIFPGDQIFARCKAEAHRVFVEGDGSKKRPLKVPASHEPCIPPESDTVIAVAGLSALGKPLSEVGFRLELLCPLFSVTPDTVVTPELMAQVIAHPLGLKKSVPEHAAFLVYLNQADDEERLSLGRDTGRLVQALLPHCRVVIGRMRPTPQVLEVLP